jgi:type IX secretion system PorP/SprF family membrane protein
MKKMLKHILIAFVVLTSKQLKAQDPNFSQFYNNPVYYNPAMTAINNGITFRANARSLWTPIPGKFNTSSVTLEAEAINKLGVGILAMTDVAGEGFLRTSGANMYYSYRPLDTKNMIFQVGFSAGIFSKNIDWSRLTFSDNFDEVFGNVYTSAFIPPNFNSSTYADFGTGFAMRFNHKRKKTNRIIEVATTTIGGAVHHLTKPKDALLGDLERLPMKFVGHATSQLLINRRIYAPAVIYERQNQFQTVTIGSNFTFRPYTIGFWVRNRTFLMSGQSYDSFMASIGTNLPISDDNSLRITYSFDMTISRLRTSSIGSHEVSLVLDFDNRKLFSGLQSRKNSRRKYRCPHDFKGYN